MKALEHAKAVEHWVSGDAGIRGDECRAAAAELRRLAEVNAELLGTFGQVLEILENSPASKFVSVMDAMRYIKNASSKAKEQQ